jgi:hypothetical protein
MPSVISRSDKIHLDVTYLLRAKIRCPEYLFRLYAPKTRDRIQKYRTRGYAVTISNRIRDQSVLCKLVEEYFSTFENDVDQWLRLGDAGQVAALWIEFWNKQEHNS